MFYDGKKYRELKQYKYDMLGKTGCHFSSQGRQFTVIKLNKLENLTSVQYTKYE
jgi:hypothetical protein